MSDKPCVFCDRSQFEEQLVGETRGFWIIATLGQIPKNGGYVLLVPKWHVSCFGAMEPWEARLVFPEIEKIVSALLREYATSPSPVIFEHGIVGQTVKHAHLHITPVMCNITDRVRMDFPQSLTVRVMSRPYEYWDDWNRVQKMYSETRKPYLLWNDGYVSRVSGTKICWDPPAPPQYLRLVVANEAGRPERGDWKAMYMDPALKELDRKLIAETVVRLSSYFR